MANEQIRTRIAVLKLGKCRFKKEISENWFPDRLVGEWNALSSHVVLVIYCRKLQKKVGFWIYG